VDLQSADHCRDIGAFDREGGVAMSKEYLGDAVYAEIGAYGIVLTTSDGISDTNTIYLEPEVLEALEAFIEKQKKREGS